MIEFLKKLFMPYTHELHKLNLEIEKTADSRGCEVERILLEAKKQRLSLACSSVPAIDQLLSGLKKTEKKDR